MVKDPLEDTDQSERSSRENWPGIKVLVKTISERVNTLDEKMEDLRSMVSGIVTEMAVVKERQTKGSWITPERVLAFLFVTGQGIVVAWLASKIGGKP